jgi:DNA-binding NarL/FixJ family response regulator
MPSSAYGPPARPALDVVLAIRNDLQRYGIQQMLAGLGESDGVSGASGAGPGVRVGRVRSAADPAAALADAGPGDGIVVLALSEVGEELRARLGTAVERGVRVLLLIDGTALEPLRRLPELRGAGYLDTADLDAVSLAGALAAFADGAPPVPSWLLEALMRAWRREPVARARPRMTPRERETLGLLVEGLSNRQIARRLGISEHGAKRLVANILAKLDCSNRTSAVALALRDGLCEDAPGPVPHRHPHAAPQPAPPPARLADAHSQLRPGAAPYAAPFAPRHLDRDAG